MNDFTFFEDFKNDLIRRYRDETGYAKDSFGLSHFELWAILRYFINSTSMTVGMSKKEHKILAKDCKEFIDNFFVTPKQKYFQV